MRARRPMKRLAAALVSASALAVWGCSPAKPAPKPPPALSQPPPAGAVAEYVLSSAAVADEAPPIDGGAHGVLVDGMRYAVGKNITSATMTAEPPLTGFAVSPNPAVHGFVFWSERNVYYAPEFLGDLTPLARSEKAPDLVLFGNESVVVQFPSGKRVWRHLPGSEPSAIAPQGARLATAVGKRMAAVLEDNRVVVSIDGGKTFRPGLDPWTDRRSRRLATEDGTVWIMGPDEHDYRLTPSGSLERIPRPPDPRKASADEDDRRGKAAEPLIDRAVRAGVMVDQATAVVESEGSIVWVDVATGAAKRRSPPIITTREPSTCQAVRAPDGVLVVCRAGRDFENRAATVVISGIGAGQPRIEQSFQKSGRLFLGARGVLIAEGPCAAAEVDRAGFFCLRRAPGDWIEIDQTAAFELQGKNVWPAVVLPEADGAMVLVIIKKASGNAIVMGDEELGCLDTRTGKVTRWGGGVGLWLSSDKPDPKTENDITLGRIARELARDGGVVDSTWTRTKDGELVGFIKSGIAHIDATGRARIDEGPSFAKYASAGSRALAVGKDGRIRQTLDHGKTWTEVSAPPGAVAGRPIEPKHCTDVGCAIGPFLRIGWPESKAHALLRARNAPALQERPVKRPILSCEPDGQARSEAVPSLPEPKAEKSWVLRTMGFELPPKGVAGSDLTLQAYSYDDSEAVGGWLWHRDTGARSKAPPRPRLSALVQGPAYGEKCSETKSSDSKARPPKPKGTYDLFVAAPLDPSGGLIRKTFSMSGARAAIGRCDSFVGRWGTVYMSAHGMGSERDRAAIPILDSKHAGVVLALAGSVVAVAGAAPDALLFSPSLAAREAKPLSAVALDDQHVVLLMDEGSAVAAVEIMEGNPRLVFEMPRPATPLHPDALAVGAGGELAVIRLASGDSPPDAADPAILLRPDKPLAVLAPWASAQPANSPDCKADRGGYRAIVRVADRWFDVRGLDRGSGGGGSTLARVRWSPNRLCVEAIDVDAGTAPLPDGSAISTGVVAVFDERPDAARLSIAPGATFRQPMRCTISAP
jgi:hypothetical protein